VLSCALWWVVAASEFEAIGKIQFPTLTTGGSFTATMCPREVFIQWRSVFLWWELVPPESRNIADVE
jgi:hypothetical protein